MDQDVLPRSTTWTLYGPIIVTWNTLCVFLLVEAWYKTTEGNHLAFALYFQPFLPALTMVWLWATNIWIFETLQIPYQSLFEDSTQLLTSSQLFQIATAFSALLLTAMTVFLTSIDSGFQHLAEWVPIGFLVLTLMLWLLPIDRFFKNSRMQFSKTVLRVLFPLKRVTFSDFLLADVSTSLARSIADWVRGSCAFTVSQNLDPISLEWQCGKSSILSNFVLALPYLIRMIQCLSVFLRDQDKVQLMNAVKYCTAFPVIFSSMMKHRVSTEDWMKIWNRVWIFASLVNTGYSYYWDVEMDWDLSFFKIDKQSQTTTKPDPLYSPQWIYSLALISNFTIRIAWIYKLSFHLPVIHGVHLLVSLLEVLRRSQWILFRFENGLSKKGFLIKKSSVGKRPI